MEPGIEALAGAVGERVRLERQGRGWTLDQLAASAGVSRRMVVHVEQGEANPSIGTLLRLADALGVGLPTLVEPPRTGAVRVTRSGDGAALWAGAAGGRGVLVASTRPPDVVELWEWTLASGDRHDSEAHSAGTKELLQVQEGEVVVEVADESYELSPGDAISFPGDVPHAYVHAGLHPARFALAVFEPGVATPIASEPSHD